MKSNYHVYIVEKVYRSAYVNFTRVNLSIILLEENKPTFQVYVQFIRHTQSYFETKSLLLNLPGLIGAVLSLNKKIRFFYFNNVIFKSILPEK